MVELESIPVINPFFYDRVVFGERTVSEKIEKWLSESGIPKEEEGITFIPSVIIPPEEPITELPVVPEFKPLIIPFTIPSMISIPPPLVLTQGPKSEPISDLPSVEEIAKEKEFKEDIERATKRLKLQQLERATAEEEREAKKAKAEAKKAEIEAELENMEKLQKLEEAKIRLLEMQIKTESLLKKRKIAETEQSESELILEREQEEERAKKIKFEAELKQREEEERIFLEEQERIAREKEIKEEAERKRKKDEAAALYQLKLREIEERSRKQLEEEKRKLEEESKKRTREEEEEQKKAEEIITEDFTNILSTISITLEDAISILEEDITQWKSIPPVEPSWFTEYVNESKEKWKTAGEKEFIKKIFYTAVAKRDLSNFITLAKTDPTKINEQWNLISKENRIEPKLGEKIIQSLITRAPLI